MGQRSKVITALPKDLRDQLDQKLVTGSFSDYRGLEAWLGTQGFRISRGSLQRYGSAFERRIKTIGIATQQARALAEASPDREGSMTDAPAWCKRNCLASWLKRRISRTASSPASPARSRTWGGRRSRKSAGRKRCASASDKQKRAAGEKMDEIKRAGGLSDAAYEAMRAVLLDIDPIATKEQNAGSHHAASYLR